MIQYNKKSVSNGIFNGEIIKNITDNNNSKLLEYNNIYIKDFYDEKGEFVQFRVAQILDTKNINNIKNYLLLFLRNKERDNLTYIGTIEVDKDFKLSRAQQLVNGLGNRGINTIESYYENISNFEKVIHFSYKQLTNSNFNTTSDISFILGDDGFNKITSKEDKLLLHIQNDKTSELGDKVDNYIIFGDNRRFPNNPEIPDNPSDIERKCFTFEGNTYYIYKTKNDSANRYNYYVIEAGKYVGEQFIQFEKDFIDKNGDPTLTPNEGDKGYFYINDNKFEITVNEDPNLFYLSTKSYFLCMLNVKKQNHTWSILSLPYENNNNIEFFICIFLKDSDALLNSDKFQYELDFVDKDEISDYEDKTFDLYDYNSNAALILRDGDFVYPELYSWTFPARDYNTSLDEVVNYPLNIMNSKYNEFISYSDFDYTINGLDWFDCHNNNQTILKDGVQVKIETGVIDVEGSKKATFNPLEDKGNYIYYKLTPELSNCGDIVIKGRNKLTISILNNPNNDCIFLRFNQKLEEYIDILSTAFKVEKTKELTPIQNDKVSSSKFLFTPCENNFYLDSNNKIKIYSKIDEESIINKNNVVKDNIAPSGKYGGFIGIACYLFGQKISNNNQWLDSSLFTVKEINIINIENNIYEIENNKLIDIETKKEYPFLGEEKFYFSNKLDDKDNPICWRLKDEPNIYKYIKVNGTTLEVAEDYKKPKEPPENWKEMVIIGNDGYNFTIQNADTDNGEYFIYYNSDNTINTISKKDKNLYNEENISKFVNFDKTNKVITSVKFDGVNTITGRIFSFANSIILNNKRYLITQDDEGNYKFEGGFKI